MTLSKVSFSKLLENDFWDHPDTLEFFDFYTFDFYTFKNHTFENARVDRLHLYYKNRTAMAGFVHWYVFSKSNLYHSNQFLI